MLHAPAPIASYSEIAPPADLAPYVDRLWLRAVAGGAPGRVYRVLPDGCVDVIVHADRGAAELVGTMTRAVEVPDTASPGRRQGERPVRRPDSPLAREVPR